MEIIESMWGDIRHRKVVICDTTALAYGERSGYTPTTTAPKRPHGRTFSEKSRTVSDLRGVNVGIDRTEFRPIWLPDMNDTAERVMENRMQFPGAPAKICKRDISNAFKRALLRPDYSAIFCHQFDAESSQAGEDIALAWMALPFGFSAAPAIFALCAEVIQRTHHSMESENGSWSGRGPFHSEIFVGDAIFVESDIGNISDEVVGGWEWCCRS